jgi:hypothetical protein
MKFPLLRLCDYDADDTDSLCEDADLNGFYICV